MRKLNAALRGAKVNIRCISYCSVTYVNDGRNSMWLPLITSYFKRGESTRIIKSFE